MYTSKHVLCNMLIRWQEYGLESQLGRTHKGIYGSVCMSHQIIWSEFPPALGGKWKSLLILCFTLKHYACFWVKQANLEIHYTSFKSSQWLQCTHYKDYDCVSMNNRMDMLAISLYFEWQLSTHMVNKDLQ